MARSVRRTHSSHHHDSPFGVGVAKAGADRSVPQPEQGRDSMVIDIEVTHYAFWRTIPGRLSPGNEACHKSPFVAEVHPGPLGPWARTQGRGRLRKRLNDLDHILASVPVEPSELKKLTYLLNHGAFVNRTGHGHASAPAELKEAFVSQDA